MTIALRTEESFSAEMFSQTVLWAQLAKDRRLRLPLWRMQCTTGGMRRWLKKIKRDPNWYLDYSGERTLKVFAQNNPDWPLRAFAGICLEWVEEEENGNIIQSSQGSS